MQIIDKTEIPRKYNALWDKVDTIDKKHYSTVWVQEPAKVDVDRQHHHFFHRRDFQVAVDLKKKTASITVFCRGKDHNEYDSGFLQKLGELLEVEQLTVAAYLVEA